jgi:lysophospholipase L1-like esterase
MSNSPWKRFIRAGVVGVVVLAVVTVLGATTVSAHVPKQVVVGMGDSFTSGQGAPPFFPRTDTKQNTCHRSIVAYPLVAGALSRKTTARNVACSGAVTDDLFREFKTEAAQVSRLQGATDIALTIGGNDIDALGAVTNPPTPEEYAAKLQALAPKLVATYKRVQAAAPGAELHVLGYPILFAAGPQEGCFVDQARREFLITAQKALNQTIQQAAAYAGVEYVDDSAVFAGHEVCTDRPWVNGVVEAHPEYSLHPNQAGQLALGRVLERAL